VFLLVRAVPGDPARLLLKNPTPERIAAIHIRLGLDRPLPVQYWLWLKNVLGHASFGESIVTGRDVKEDLARTWPATIELSVVALVVATLAACGSESSARATREHGRMSWERPSASSASASRCSGSGCWPCCSFL
jgi:peptide/nickel transport system permease protein